MRPVAWFFATAGLTVAARAGEPFFDIKISLAPGDTYLEGEGIAVEIAISNNTGKHLKYLAAGEHMSALRFVVSNDQGVVLPTEHGGIIQAPCLAKSLVCGFSPGGPMTRRLPVIPGHGDLGPGDYALTVHLEQNLTDWGLAKGKADSNSVSFSIIPWEPVRTRTLAVDPPTPKEAGLLESNTGHMLVGWRYPGRSPWFALTRVAEPREYRAVAWAADAKNCFVHMVAPNGDDSLVSVNMAKRTPSRLPWTSLEGEDRTEEDAMAASSSRARAAQDVTEGNNNGTTLAMFLLGTIAGGVACGLLVFLAGRFWGARKQTASMPEP